MNRRIRRLSAVAGAMLGLFLPHGAALAVASVPAPAALTNPLTGDLNPALIRPDALGSLVLHSHLAPTNAGSAAYQVDGSVTPTTPAQAGVVFTVSRVDGVDLRTTAGWQQAVIYRGNLALAQANLGATRTAAPTGPDGVTTVADLPVGLYLVRQQSALRADGSVDQTVTRAADFLVTVPTTDPRTGASWLYDLHVYPKVSRISISKAVADGNNEVAGQDAPSHEGILTYMLTADVPADGLRALGGHCRFGASIDTRSGADARGFTETGYCANGANYLGTTDGGGYVISDDLSRQQVPGTSRFTSDYLALKTDTWTGAVSVALGGSAPATLTTCAAPSPGCQALVIHEPSRIEVRFTDAGLVSLAAAKANSPDTVVSVSFQAIVLESLESAGDAGYDSAGVLRLPNTAHLAVGATTAQVAALDAIASNTVQTAYAALRLHKIDATSKVGLAGAVFTVYRSRTDALAQRNPVAVTAPTGADGMTMVAGLHVTDFQNNGPDADSYWLVETVVPKGYVGLAEPLAVRLLQDGTTDLADATGGFPVPNPKAGSGGLAYTGFRSEIELALAVGLIGGGALLVFFGRRRRHDEAADDLAHGVTEDMAGSDGQVGR